MSETAEAGRIHLEPSWKARLGDYLERPPMRALAEFLREERRAGKVIYPPGPEIFNAFAHTPFDAVRVVILGQDPYHGPGQAHGLCFSVRPGVPVPPSLANIFAEIERDLDIPRPDHGCLTAWAEQGVLLLNAVLTVRAHQPNSHKGKGWETFTDAVIRRLSERDAPLVFVLWGAHAHKKVSLIDADRHTIIRSAHPSPLSAHSGFFGSKPFSAIDAALRAYGKPAIDWQLPDLPQ